MIDISIIGKNDTEVIEPSGEAIRRYNIYHGFFGVDVIKLDANHLEALQAGKMLACSNGEAPIFVVLSGYDD